MVRSINPRTGASFGPEFPDTPTSEVELIIARSRKAFEAWSATTPTKRAEVLDVVAGVVDLASAELVELSLIHI